jgi:hypothetical protein
MDHGGWHLALENGKVLTPTLLERAQTALVPENDAGTSYYGYGWTIFPLDDERRLVAHNGGTGVFFADLHRYVDDDVVLVLASNQETDHVMQVWRQVVRQTLDDTR